MLNSVLCNGFPVYLHSQPGSVRHGNRAVAVQSEALFRNVLTIVAIRGGDITRQEESWQAGESQVGSPAHTGLQPATARGIPVGNTPDVLTDATADFAFALLMAVARRIPEGERYVHEGKWKTWGPKLLLGVDIKGATLGLVGFGRIGQAVARRAAGFDMRVIYYDPKEVKSNQDPKAQRVDFETLLEESDFISNHTPLTPDTRHLIDAEALSKMKPNALLINTARGPIVDPDALYEALRSKRIFGAGLDVTEPEPILLDSPLLQQADLRQAMQRAWANLPRNYQWLKDWEYV